MLCCCIIHSYCNAYCVFDVLILHFQPCDIKYNSNITTALTIMSSLPIVLWLRQFSLHFHGANITNIYCISTYVSVSYKQLKIKMHYTKCNPVIIVPVLVDCMSLLSLFSTIFVRPLFPRVRVFNILWSGNFLKCWVEWRMTMTAIRQDLWCAQNELHSGHCDTIWPFYLFGKSLIVYENNDSFYSNVQNDSFYSNVHNDSFYSNVHSDSFYSNIIVVS